MRRKDIDKMTRPPLDRMIKIHERIQSGMFPNCRTMGEDNSVDPDTIGRDIAFMRERWGLPIVYNRSKHGYYYSASVKEFLHLFSISEQELFAVTIIEKTVQQYQGTSCYEPLRMLLEKIKHFLSPSKKYALKNLQNTLITRPSSVEETNYQTFQAVSESIERQRVLKVRYRNHNSTEVKERVLHPYALACVENRWYMAALDPAINKVKTYVLSRMSDLVITKEKFKVPKDFNLDDFLMNCFRIMGGNENHDVVIEFDSWGTDVICDRRWHPTQVFERLPEGRSRITMQLNSLEEIEGWVLSHSGHPTVMQPPALQDRIERVAGELKERYCRIRMERESGRTNGSEAGG